jgi:alkylhydroperoxidase family enzyme
MSVAATVQNDLLEQIEKTMGFVPNMMREMNTSPAVLRVYQAGMAAMANASLSPRRQQAVMLALSAGFECPYCTTAHGMACKGQKIAQADIDALKAGQLPADSDLIAPVKAAWLLQQKQGKLTADEIAELEADGIDRAMLYEILALKGLKVITSHVDHLAHLPIDPQFGG